MVLKIGLQPFDTVEKGLVWPPVKGRELLHEAVSEMVIWVQHSRYEAFGFGEQWLFCVDRDLVFEDRDRAREMLLELARNHARMDEIWDGRRSLAVVPTEDGRWALWQIAWRGRPITEVLEKLAWSNRDAHDSIELVFAQWNRLHDVERVVADSPKPHPVVRLENIDAFSESAPLVGLCQFETDEADDEDRETEFLSVFEALNERLPTVDLEATLEQLASEHQDAADFVRKARARLASAVPTKVVGVASSG